MLSDIELPDFGANNLGLEMDRGVFLKKKRMLDSNSTFNSSDSGNNSISTNASGKNSKLMYNHYSRAAGEFSSSRS